MKLKTGFITHQRGKTQVMVGTSATHFSGIVRSNPTAAFIVDQLKTDTTEEAIIETMLARYDDAPRELVERDVKKVVETLREIGAIDE